MSDQPLALLLADELYASYGNTDLDLNDRVTAELRRQHSEIEQLKAERDAAAADASRFVFYVESSPARRDAIHSLLRSVPSIGL